MRAVTPTTVPVPPLGIAAELEHHRDELGDDYRFILRCQDGVYGPLAAEIALHVVAGGTVDGSDPTDAQVADEILTEIRQTERDADPLAA